MNFKEKIKMHNTQNRSLSYPTKNNKKIKKIIVKTMKKSASTHSLVYHMWNTFHKYDSHFTPQI